MAESIPPRDSMPRKRLPEAINFLKYYLRSQDTEHYFLLPQILKENGACLRQNSEKILRKVGIYLYKLLWFLGVLYSMGTTFAMF